MKLDKSILTTSTLAGITLLSGAILTSVTVNADTTDVVDEINITVPVSCTMTGTGMNSHTAEVVNGTYRSEIGTTTLKAFCNDANGFAIYAAGYTNDTIGEENSNKLVGSATIGNISTGTATSGNTSNWAMKLATPASATYPITLDNGFNNYHAVPNEYTKVAHRDSTTDTGASAEGASLTTTYAAYISNTQPAGTYAGKVIYTLVHPSTEPAPVVCNKNATTIAQAKCMQDFSGPNSQSIIDSMELERTYTLTDKRDNKTYTIAKLKDGNVWMTQNLDLDIDQNKTYTNEDTDLGYNTNTNQYESASWKPERSTYPTGTETWGELGEDPETGNPLAYTHPESYDPGNLYVNPAMVEYNATGEGEQPESATLTTGTPNNHLGNYYNWTAALATNDSSNYGKENPDTGEYENLNTNQSICPAGWTLPIGGDVTESPANKSFQNLVEKYGWTSDSYEMKNPNIWNSPIKLALSGLWYGGEAPESVGYLGYFWSSVADGSDLAYYLGAASGGDVYPGDYDDRNNGLTVRCVSR